MISPGSRQNIPVAVVSEVVRWSTISRTAWAPRAVKAGPTCITRCDTCGERPIERPIEHPIEHPVEQLIAPAPSVSLCDRGGDMGHAVQFDEVAVVVVIVRGGRTGDG